MGCHEKVLIGHQNTQNVSKCINSTSCHPFTLWHVWIFVLSNKSFFARIEIRKQPYHQWQTQPSLLLRPGRLIQGPHHAPCSDHLSSKDGIDTYIERDGSNISFGQKQLLSLARGKAAKMCFFFSPVFLFLCHIWSVNLVLNMKNAREARPVTVSCPATVILLFCLVFSGRQFSWTKAWWCGNLQYSFWMNVPQPWILSHRKRHRKPSWRISPGADDGWGSIVLKKSAAFWTSNFWGYPGIPMNTTSTRGSVDLPHGCWIGLYFFGCRTTTIAVAHRLVACLEWSIYCSWMLLLQYERKKCRSFMWPLSWFHSVLGCLGLTPGCPFSFWTCCDIWIWLPGLRWHVGHFGDLRKQSWTLTRSWYSKGATWSNQSWKTASAHKNPRCGMGMGALLPAFRESNWNPYPRNYNREWYRGWVTESQRTVCCHAQSPMVEIDLGFGALDIGNMDGNGNT